MCPTRPIPVANQTLQVSERRECAEWHENIGARYLQKLETPCEPETRPKIAKPPGKDSLGNGIPLFEPSNIYGFADRFNCRGSINGY